MEKSPQLYAGHCETTFNLYIIKRCFLDNTNSLWGREMTIRLQYTVAAIAILAFMTGCTTSESSSSSSVVAVLEDAATNDDGSSGDSSSGDSSSGDSSSGEVNTGTTETGNGNVSVIPTAVYFW